MQSGPNTPISDNDESTDFTKDVCKGSYEGFRKYVNQYGIIDLDLSTIELPNATKIIIHYLYAIEGTSITNINLSHNNIGDKGIKAIADVIQANSNLKSINFSYTNLTYKGIKILEHAIPTTAITINFSGNHIEDIGAKIISRMIQSRSATWTSIILSDISISPSGVNIIAKALLENANDREIIDLSNNKINDEGFKAIVSALDKKEIGSLNLAYNSISDGGVRILERMSAKICHLNLAYNKIGDQGAKSISKMEDALEKTSRSLITLDLSGNQIKNMGAIYITQKFAGNAELNFSYNFIEDEGANAIVKLFLQRTSKKNINLHYNLIKENCVLFINSSKQRLFPSLNMGSIELSYQRQSLKVRRNLFNVLPGELNQALDQLTQAFQPFPPVNQENSIYGLPQSFLNAWQHIAPVIPAPTNGGISNQVTTTTISEDQHQEDQDQNYVEEITKKFTEFNKKK